MKRRVVMRTSLTVILSGIFFLFLIPPFAFSQNVQTIDSLFYQGVQAYRDGHYLDALKTMESLDGVYPGHHRLTGSLLIQAKALYKLKKYDSAYKIFKRILKDYPQSKYCDDAKYGIATVLYRQKKYKDCVRELLDVVGGVAELQLKKKAARLSSDIMDYCLGREDFRDLFNEVSGEKSKAAVAMKFARKEMKDKRFHSAEIMLKEFLNSFPDSQYALQVRRLLKRVEEEGKNLIKIGVILPLSGPLSEQGKKLLEGLQYAVDVYNKADTATAELIVRDSRADILRAVLAAQQLCSDEEVVALIGEIEDDITVAIAGIAQENGVPLIAPTSTLDDLTLIGDYIFQTCTNLRMRSKMLAEYGVKGLGLNKFAILAPEGKYGESMRQGFVDEVQRLGGEIVIEKWYYEGAEDWINYIGTQLKAIREEGIKRMIEDSLIVIVPEEEWDEEEYANRTDALYVNQTIEDLVDSTDLAVTSIDGIFLPIYTEHIKYVATQLAYYNIPAKIFGGAFWYDEKVLKEHRKYIDGVFFLSNYYVDPSNYRFYRLRDDYRLAMGKSPERMSVIGFDIANLILSLTGDRLLSRDQVRNRFLKMKPFKGVKGTISFNDNRINRFISLLQYKNGEVIRIR